MPDNSKIKILEANDWNTLETIINADITTEEAGGFGVSDVDISTFVDTANDGAVKSMAVLTYNKASGEDAQSNGIPGLGGLRPSTGPTLFPSIGVSSTALPALAEDTTHVLVTSEAASFRALFDGNDPTALVGSLFGSSYSEVWSREIYEAAKAIRTGVTNASLTIVQLKII